ncbi:hypothetical protein [Methylacidimicrobium sp. AP8]|uniref:hypothetical protein n=1 Tax=Methylacidimicrobium sp. AP8 TaxID=2730359 RepID=UPI0019204311|nr:hypothetical protein [Methylacidimicrobium sp. AP8]
MAFDGKTSLKEEEGRGLDSAILESLERHPERLPLEVFCEDGGWPGPWRAHIEEIRRSEDRVAAILSVSFAERISACCDLGSAKEEAGYYEIPRYGRLEVRWMPRSGDMTIRPLL